jgi:hypothetical protein
VQDVPAAVSMNTASASGIEWFTATNSRLNGPSLDDVALLDLGRGGLDAVLAQLRLEQREGEPRAEIGMSWRSRSR